MFCIAYCRTVIKELHSSINVWSTYFCSVMRIGSPITTLVRRSSPKRWFPHASARLCARHSLLPIDHWSVTHRLWKRRTKLFRSGAKNVNCNWNNTIYKQKLHYTFWCASSKLYNKFWKVPISCKNSYFCDLLNAV